MCIPRILALGTHSISLPLITMGSKELFAVLKVIRSSLHFASLSWNLSSAALVTKVSTAAWNKNAGNWGKALQKKEREKINKCLRENYGQKTTDEMKTSNNLLTRVLTKTEGPILEIPTIRNV